MEAEQELQRASDAVCEARKHARFAAQAATVLAEREEREAAEAAAAAKAAELAHPMFIAAKKFDGIRDGYFFAEGVKGRGYYSYDTGPGENEGGADASNQKQMEQTRHEKQVKHFEEQLRQVCGYSTGM